MPKRVLVGDLIEISTEKGLAYAQYTHRDSLMGSLIRVRSGMHAVRPSDPHVVFAERVQFITFVPLGAMVNRAVVKVVANLPIPLEDQAFPVFRNGVRSLADGSMRWWLWDGKTEVPVTSLTPEQRHYPLRATWNDTMLVERICSGWTHAHDVQ